MNDSPCLASSAALIAGSSRPPWSKASRKTPGAIEAIKSASAAADLRCGDGVCRPPPEDRPSAGDRLGLEERSEEEREFPRTMPERPRGWRAMWREKAPSRELDGEGGGGFYRCFARRRFAVFRSGGHPEVRWPRWLLASRLGGRDNPVATRDYTDNWASRGSPFGGLFRVWRRPNRGAPTDGWEYPRSQIPIDGEKRPLAPASVNP